MLARTATPASTTRAAPAAAAPWRSLFAQHIGQMALPVCAVSTLHPADDGSNTGRTASTMMATPRVRHCMFRGFWADLPHSTKNPAPRNPAVYECDLPVFTTDGRMAKAWEIAASAPAASIAGRVDGKAVGIAVPAMTCGGGPIEAVWWASDAGTQWRVRGTAWVLGPDIEGPAGTAARAAIQKRMRICGREPGGDGGGDVTAWSWTREITGHFGNLSPTMRGHFRSPPPGRPRPARGDDGNRTPGEGIGAPVDDTDLDNAAARANFRVCVIVPTEVDRVDLSRGDDPRRWLYTYVGEEEAQDGEVGGDAAKEVVNGWTETEVWP